jgi:hypothetical protein
MESNLSSPEQPLNLSPTSPYIQRNRNTRRYLEGNGILVDRVLRVTAA